MVSVCVLMAGSGQRCHINQNKVLYKINNTPLYMYSVLQFIKSEEVEEVIIVVNHNDYDEVCSYINKHHFKKAVHVILGGATRMESSYLGVKKAKASTVVIHDAARPLITIEDINNLLVASTNKDICIACEKVVDTIKTINNGKIDKTINRENLLRASTPQVVNKEKYLKYYQQAINDNIICTDEAMLFEYNNCDIDYYILQNNNIKVTTIDDLNYVKYRLNDMEIKIGHSNDIHRLVPGKKLFLGGIEIESTYGLEAHSDGDCLLHAITEAIIGALGLGDIGMHFSDQDEKYRGISSNYFLDQARLMLIENNYCIVNIDSIVYCERPKLQKYKKLMEENIASILQIDANRVNVKATCKEQTGPIGRGEAIEAEAVCLIKKII